MSKEKYVIDTKDYRGKRVIFTKKKRIEKSITHPELRSDKFIENVKRAIEKPTHVWQDYDDKKRKRCYYWKYSPETFVKVVIWVAEKPCVVVTAFLADWIKETKYPELKDIK